MTWQHASDDRPEPTRTRRSSERGSKYHALLLCFSLSTLAGSPGTSHAQWVDTHGPASEASSFAVSGTNLFAGGIDGRVYLSPDDGTSWTSASAGLSGANIHAMASAGANLLVGTWGGGIFLSTNQGTSWAAANTGFTNGYANAFAVSATDVFVASQGSGVYRSHDGGVSWIQTGLTSGDVSALTLSGADLFAGVWGLGVYKSSDNGTNWTAVNTGLTNKAISAFAVSDTTIFVGTDSGGVFASSDNGANWTAVNSGLINGWVTSFAVIGTHLLAGSHNGGGVFQSSDNGAHWASFGLAGQSVWSLVTSGANVFAALDFSAWRLPLTDVTAVEQTSAQVPARYAVYPNYPNPFNRSTTIAYALAKGAHVTLDVYDVLGERVASVVSEWLPAGTYKATWDAAGVVSGVYFYRFHAGSYTETRKLLVLR
jgi:photosystem II stability/assembly factor-like uncharacterized protein